MMSLLVVLVAAVLLPAWRWLQALPNIVDSVSGGDGHDSAGVAGLLLPVMVLTSLLQLSMIGSWILYRRQLMLSAAQQRERERENAQIGISLLNENMPPRSPVKPPSKPPSPVKMPAPSRLLPPAASMAAACNFASTGEASTSTCNFASGVPASPPAHVRAAPNAMGMSPMCTYKPRGAAGSCGSARNVLHGVGDFES